MPYRLSLHPNAEREASREWRDDWFALTGAKFSRDTWWNFVHPKSRPDFGAELSRATYSGVFSLEYRLRCKDGAYHLVRGYGESLPNGTRWGYVMLIEADHKHVCLADICHCAWGAAEDLCN